MFKQRGEQRVSLLCIVLVGGAWLFAAVALVVTLCHKITWLTYLYYFSYIKIGVTLIKYVPQVRCFLYFITYSVLTLTVLLQLCLMMDGFFILCLINKKIILIYDTDYIKYKLFPGSGIRHGGGSLQLT